MPKLTKTAFSEILSSPVGRMVVCCSWKGVRSVEFVSPARNDAGARGRVAFAARSKLVGRDGKAERLARETAFQLQQYFAGVRTHFTLPLDLEGTPFQRKVWRALQRIPYGETRSYQTIARLVGNAHAARAVGMANHTNPIAILIPCHRVISSDGSLGGYGGGIEIKAKLLQLERGALQEALPHRRRPEAVRQPARVHQKTSPRIRRVH